MATWVQAYTAVWSGFSATNTPGSAGSPLAGSSYIDVAGAWFTAGGSVTAQPISSGGSYTVAPAIAFSAPTGSSSRKVTASGTLVLTAGAITGITWTTTGVGYIANPTSSLSGGTGSGGALGTPTITGIVATNLLTADTGSSNLAFGPLLTPQLLTTDAQHVSIGHCTASSDVLVSLTNFQQGGAFPGSGLAAVALNNGLYIYALRGTAASAIGSIAYSGGSFTPSHQYNLTFNTQFTATQVVSTATLTDLTTSATIGTLSVTTLASSLAPTYWAALNQPGQAGTIFYFNTAGAVYDSLTAYNLESIISTPAQAPINAPTYTLNLLGVGTTWTNTTVFTLTGVTGASVLSAVVSSATSAVVQIQTGANTGIATLGDSITTGPLTIETAIPPNLSIISQGPGTNTIATSGPALAVVPPWTYYLYSSPLSNQATSAARLISTQPGLGVNQTPANVVDTGAAPGTTVYFNVITDAEGQTVVDDQIMCVTLSTKVIRLGVIGDSIAQGFEQTALSNTYTQKVISIVPLTPGSNLVGPFTFTFSGGAGSGAAIGAYSIVGGVLQWLYTDPEGFGYTSLGGAPTLTMTAASGTLPTFFVNIGGGWVFALQCALQNNYGYPDCLIFNASVGGKSSADFTPHGTGSGPNAGYFLEAAIAKFVANGVNTCFYGIGTNDFSLDSLTLAQYQSNLALTIAALVASGITTVILIPPIWANSLASGLSRYTPAVLLLMQQAYSVVFPTLAAEFPDNVIIGPDLFSLSLANPEMLGIDGLHPEPPLYGLMAAAIEQIASETAGLATFYNGAPFIYEGNFNIVVGDDYLALDGRNLGWTSSLWNPLVGATVSFIASNPIGILATSISGQGTLSQTVSVNLPRSLTSLLSPGNNIFYRLVATLSDGSVTTLAQGQIIPTI